MSPHHLACADREQVPHLKISEPPTTGSRIAGFFTDLLTKRPLAQATHNFMRGLHFHKDYFDHPCFSTWKGTLSTVSRCSVQALHHPLALGHSPHPPPPFPSPWDVLLWQTLRGPQTFFYGPKRSGPTVTAHDASPTPNLCSNQTGWVPQPADPHGAPPLPPGRWLLHQHQLPTPSAANTGCGPHLVTGLQPPWSLSGWGDGGPSRVACFLGT